MSLRPITTASAPSTGIRCSASRAAEIEQTRVEGVQAVDVLQRVDGADGARLVEVRRQGQLDEDPVDRFVGVQLGNDLEQFLLGDLRRQLPVLRVNGRGLRRLVLSPQVDRGGRVLPHL
jgi:hypothetical protein